MAGMRIHFWNTAFGILYIALVVGAVEWLMAHDRLPSSVALGAFLLMALAIFRLVRLFTYDNITAFVRDWFVGCAPQSCGDTLGVLINCPWCMGLWFALIVPFFYYATPYSWFVILVLALAAVGSLFQLLSNLVGWYAEGKKREVQGR
jgi:prepilin signal peptidase PulO-like enzyme (type II secretory pathway)